MNLLAISGHLLAQATTVVGAAETSGIAVQSVWDFIVKGGPVMIPIGLASLLAVAVIIERAMSLRRRRVIPADFLPGLELAWRGPGGSTERALSHCRDDGSPLANILAVAIQRVDEPVEQLEKHVEQAGQREVLALRRHLRALAVIASIAPLLGLLGTIFGMIRAFQTVASSAAALGRTELLAKGIYEAMITTAAGLVVAIPVLVAYHWLVARVDRLVLEIDQMTVAFIERHVLARRSALTARSSAPRADPGGDGHDSAAEPACVAAGGA